MPIPLLFDISGGELIIVLLFVLIFFGSKGIPDMARTMGRMYRQVKDAGNEVQREIHKGANEVRRSVAEQQREMRAAVEEPKPAPSAPPEHGTAEGKPGA